MTTLDHELTMNPDLFASEIHFCLLNDGVRSRALRRLWRQAKGNSELERILEIKVAEFRRALREGRKPTVWNLPVRMVEWLSEHYQFTPPREVMTTLAYVVVVVVAIDAMKSNVPWMRIVRELLLSDQAIPSSSLLEQDVELPVYALPQARGTSGSKVDDWLVSELKRAAESADLQQVLSQRLAAGLKDEDLDRLVEAKLANALKSGAMQELLRHELQAAINGLAPEVVKQVKDAKVGELTLQEIDAALKSSQIPKQFTELIKNSIVTAKLEELVARDVEGKLKALDLKPLIKAAVPEALSDPMLAEKLAVVFQNAAETPGVGEQLRTSVVSAAGSTESKGAMQQAALTWLASDEFKKLMAAHLQKTVEAPEFQQQLKTNVTAASGSAESKAAIQQSVQAWFASEEFKKLVATAMLKAQESAKAETPVAGDSAASVEVVGAKP